MDSFETVVATILDRQGYWVRTSVKIALSPEEKREIGRPSAPRWELDVVAYSGARNELLVVECKSYLDSYGVRATSFDGSKAAEETRYKLFTDDVLRRVVLARLETQLVQDGFCPDGTKATLCLAAGKIYGDAALLRAIFERNGWRLFESQWLIDGLRTLADESYENSVASVVAKLLLREERPRAAARGSSDAAERDRLEPDTRRNVLIGALYLSKFGHEMLGYGNQDQTFERIAELLGVKKHTLKNHCDRFDPHTGSHRRGWWQVELAEDLREILEEFGEASEPELRMRLVEVLRPESQPEPAPRTRGYSTTIGSVNKNRQSVVRATGLPGTDHGQSVYVLHCGDCQNDYGANGSDLWLRKCPRCQGGAPGLAFE